MKRRDHKLWKDTSTAHFQRWAEHYDRDVINVLLFKPSHRRVLSHLRQWRRRGARDLRILDVGCGTGTLALLCSGFKSTVRSIVGVDMSENMVEQAKAKASEFGIEDRAEFLVGDSEHLPFADDSFDVVVCCNSFHHYPHQRRAVGEMHRVLVSGGRLMIIDGCRDDPFGYFIFEICVSRAEEHVHHCTADRFRRLLKQAGFVDIRQTVFGVCPPALLNAAVAGK